jgi:hypothetical protein
VPADEQEQHVPDEKDNVERAKELFVYGPIGLAMYVRDTAPSFLKVFVARGRAEVEQRSKAVGDHLGQVREMGETAAGAPQLLRLVSDGLARVRETAEGAFGALGTLSSDGPADDNGATGGPERDARDAGTERAGAGASADATPRGSGARVDAHLAIPDYDDLSASQVVDRLAGLDAADLEAIRAHEVSHRGRATILGKIEQLSRAG